MEYADSGQDEAALAVMLRNLLQRQGHADPEALRAAGEAEGEVRGRMEGEAKGRVEGEAMGRLEGRRASLLEQLTTQFGPLPAETAARIEQASLEELRCWGTRLLTAITLEETLGTGK